MGVLVIQIGFIMANALFYGLILRRQPFMRQEAAVLACQVASFFLLLLGSAVLPQLHANAAGVAIACAIGLHGIYSLSFLEAWSITQGSYSLSILIDIGESGVRKEADVIADLSAIGGKKIDDRRDSLLRLGLLCREGPSGDRHRRSPTGAMCNVAMRTILWITKGKALNS
jgi:hypothetical protein